MKAGALPYHPGRVNRHLRGVDRRFGKRRADASQRAKSAGISGGLRRFLQLRTPPCLVTVRLACGSSAQMTTRGHAEGAAVFQCIRCGPHGPSESGRPARRTFAAGSCLTLGCNCIRRHSEFSYLRRFPLAPAICRPGLVASLEWLTASGYHRGGKNIAKGVRLVHPTGCRRHLTW